MASWWVRWRLKSSTSPLFTQSCIQAQFKENIKAPRHWPLCGEFTGHRWIPRTKGQSRGKCFHLMTSSWFWEDNRVCPTLSDRIITFCHCRWMKWAFSITIAPGFSVVCWSPDSLHVHYRKKLWKIWTAQWKQWYMKFWFARKGMAPTANNIVTLMQLSRVVLWGKCNLQYKKLKINYRGMYHFLYFGKKYFHKCQDIHHHTVNL